MSAPVLRASALGLALGLFAATAGTAEDKTEAPPVDLKVGDPAPGFGAVDDQGREWKSADHYGQKWVVIYFYPGDFTPGCTAQANAFRDAMNKLTEQGVEVVGVSGDSVQTHAPFKKAQKLNFALLSDEGGSMAKAFGVPARPGAQVNAKDADGNPIQFRRAATAARWTFVIGKDGRIAYKNTKVVPAEDAKKVTEFVATAEER